MEFVLMFQLGTLRTEGQGNSTYLDFCGINTTVFRRLLNFLLKAPMTYWSLPHFTTLSANTSFGL